MSTIKIDDERIVDNAVEIKSSINEYKNTIVQAIRILEDLKMELEGKSYESLTDKLSEKIHEHKKLISECEILTDEMAKFTNDMIQAEARIVFY